MNKCDVQRCRKESGIGDETTGTHINLCDKHYKEWCDKRILFINKKLGVLMMINVGPEISRPFLLPIPKEKKAEVISDGFDIQPSIFFEGKKLFQIGCRKCDHGLWKIFTNITNKERFVAVCSNCGHEQPIPPIALENKPDVQAIPAHLIT